MLWLCWNSCDTRRQYADGLKSSQDVPPTRWDESVVKHCTITSDLSSLDKKSAFDRRWRKWHRYYTANYELVMGVRNNNLTIHLEYRGRQYGAAKVEFDDIKDTR